MIAPNFVTEAIGRSLYAFNASKELAWAWNAQENLILYGPGGYGKSDAALMFFKLLRDAGEVTDSAPFVMAFGQGMTEEKLLGGLDVKSFQEEGTILYNLKNAFVSHEVVIFEEMWDAFPAVLLILKDILQSKTVRMGNQRISIRTKMVIGCTNRSRDEVVTDQSTAALLERFVFEKEVSWSSWEQEDYAAALYAATSSNKVNPLIETVAAMAAAASIGEEKVSPRTCGKAYRSAVTNGIESLQGFYAFKGSRAQEVDMEIKALDAFSARLMDFTVQIPSSAIKCAVLAKQVSLLKTPVVGDEHTERVKALLEEQGNIIKRLWLQAQALIKNAPAGSVLEKIKETHFVSSASPNQYAESPVWEAIRCG
jgi:MoxR-like ATPase